MLAVLVPAPRLLLLCAAFHGCFPSRYFFVLSVLFFRVCSRIHPGSLLVESILEDLLDNWEETRDKLESGFYESVCVCVCARARAGVLLVGVLPAPLIAENDDPPMSIPLAGMCV